MVNKIFVKKEFKHNISPPSSGGASTDHGTLTGLSDDDHPQYFNQTRGDTRYFTQSQINSFLSGKSDTGHSHTASEISDFDTEVGNNSAVTANTAKRTYPLADETKLAGIATSATANDTDANLKNRANHTGTQAISTVTNLQTTLDGKAAASHTHDDRYYTETEVDALIPSPQGVDRTLQINDNGDFGSANNVKYLESGSESKFQLTGQSATTAGEGVADFQAGSVLGSHIINTDDSTYSIQSWSYPTTPLDVNTVNFNWSAFGLSGTQGTATIVSKEQFGLPNKTRFRFTCNYTNPNGSSQLILLNPDTSEVNMRLIHATVDGVVDNDLVYNDGILEGSLYSVAANSTIVFVLDFEVNTNTGNLIFQPFGGQVGLGKTESLQYLFEIESGQDSPTTGKALRISHAGKYTPYSATPEEIVGVSIQTSSLLGVEYYDRLVKFKENTLRVDAKNVSATFGSDPSFSQSSAGLELTCEASTVSTNNVGLPAHITFVGRNNHSGTEQNNFARIRFAPKYNSTHQEDGTIFMGFVATTSGGSFDKKRPTGVYQDVFGVTKYDTTKFCAQLFTEEKEGAFNLQSNFVTQAGIDIKLIASQTGKPIQLRNTSGTTIYSVNVDGSVTTGGTSTGQSTIGEGLIVNNNQDATAIGDLVVKTALNANAIRVDASAEEILLNVLTKASQGITTMQSTGNVSVMPTISELNTLFTNVDDGFIGVIDDAGAGTTAFIATYINSNWWYTSLTKAL